MSFLCSIILSPERSEQNEQFKKKVGICPAQGLGVVHGEQSLFHRNKWNEWNGMNGMELMERNEWNGTNETKQKILKSMNTSSLRILGTNRYFTETNGMERRKRKEWNRMKDFFKK